MRIKLLKISHYSKEKVIILRIYNFYKDPQSTVEKKSVQNYVEIMKTSRMNNKTFGPQYHPSWVANNEKSSKREHWINWLREWGYLDTLNI